VPDPILKTYVGQAAQHLERAAIALAERRVTSGDHQGNVPPWPGAADADFHGTLAACWIWARHQTLANDLSFRDAREAGWSFVERVWSRFIPEAIGPDASDEAAYDCALVLRAALMERKLPGSEGGRRGPLVAGAARVLAAYLSELRDLGGRDFQDPGFLAWNLVEYARAVQDRGLLAAGRGFVERAFGMKAPPAFASEPDGWGGLFDFSSTTATRVLAVVASEGNTPFVGAWLRERVASMSPETFVPRARDENCWNACVAAMLGRAYVVSTDPAFLDSYREIFTELSRRDPTGGAALAREGDVPESVMPPDTLAAFYYALAADALVRSESAPAELARSAAGPEPYGPG
jgi:hypothetical protein